MGTGTNNTGTFVLRQSEYKRHARDSKVASLNEERSTFKMQHL